MTKIQVEVDSILKNKVRQNYLKFLQSNDEITKLSMEMTDVQKVLDR